MAKIEFVNYNTVPGVANDMQELGVKLNNELTTAYASTRDMRSHWFGVRYNTLIQGFNKVIPSINELLKLVIGEIPFALRVAANNYSQADRGQNACAAEEGVPNNIEEIAETTEPGLKFITSEVESVKGNVETNFTNAENLMDEIAAKFATAEWESEARDAFDNRFNTLKSNITSSIEDIKSQFTSLMAETISDIEKAENSSTVQ